MWVALLVALAAASITALLLSLRLRARNRALAQLQRERSLLAAERDQLRRTTERQGQLEQQLQDAGGEYRPAQRQDLFFRGAAQLRRQP